MYPLKLFVVACVLLPATSAMLAQTSNPASAGKSPLASSAKTLNSSDDSTDATDLTSIMATSAAILPVTTTSIPLSVTTPVPVKVTAPTPAVPIPQVLSSKPSQTITSTGRVTLLGHIPAVARVAAYDRGRAASSSPLEHLQMQLTRSASQQDDLDSLIAGQNDPTSASYHQWLTADEFSQRFGASAEQVQQVERWMQANGLIVEGLNKARTSIQFSSTVGAVESALHTEIHTLSVKGVEHIAPTVEPSVPASVAALVQGVSLSDFQPHPLHKDVRSLKPGASSRKFVAAGAKAAGADPSFAVDYEGDDYQIVSPGDFATIYNLTPAWQAGYRGKGQTIAVVEDTEMKAADVTTFRSAFGLSSYAGTFSQQAPVGSLPCTNPGVTGNEPEAALDAEWAGATAPDAAVVLAACADTRTEFGGLIALENLLAQTTPPQIVSISYGACEAEMGAIEINQFNAIYQQAVTQGVSVFVASGDASSSTCDADERYAAYGIQTSGFATTPYNVAVGGTDFYDTIQGSTNQYWSTTNGANYTSALSYIPEKTWNDSCADSDVLAYVGYAVAYGSAGYCNSRAAEDFLSTTGGAGGPSTVYLKPTWQNVYGVPSDGVRDIPDVSLFASNGFWGHLLVYCNSDTRSSGVPCTYTNATDAVYNAAGGTSFAAPAMAGIFALITQKYGAQGNPNTRLYALAASQYGTQTTPSSSIANCNSTQGKSVPSNCVFYDVTKGSNDVPCVTTNCYGWVANSVGIEYYGALSTSTATFASAFPAGSGWDFATGLGSINAYNLLNNWSTTSTPTTPTSIGSSPIVKVPIAKPSPIIAPITVTLQ